MMVASTDDAARYYILFIVHYVNYPKNNLNLRIKTEPVTP